LVCLKTVLKNLLLKKFSRVVVVYCSVIKVLTSLCSFATAHLFYHKHFALSRTFLKFFYFSYLFALFQRINSFILSCIFQKVKNFFEVFLFSFYMIFNFLQNQEKSPNFCHPALLI